MLPNFINKEDLKERLILCYYRDYEIPVGVIRRDAHWCDLVQWAEVAGKWYSERISRIRLNDEQLSSFKELLEEFCDENQIPFKD